MRKGNFNHLFFQIFLSLLFFTVGNITAQSPEFTAKASASRIGQHGVFEIQFELKDAEGSSFQPPDFRDFRVVGGPSLGSSTMIINGVVSQSQSWTYSLLATKQGKFTIGPAYIVVGRKKLSTRPVNVEVIAQKDQTGQNLTSSSKDQVMLVAETDAKTYYPGQQIILTYRLLFRENIQTVSTIAEDDYADFFVQHFSDFSREATMKNINGVQFTSRIIKSMALFAHQSGTFTIDPMVMNAGINAPFPGNQGFFTMRRIMDVQVASAPLELTVLPLPPDAPASFLGAVGQYSMKLVPGKTILTTDDAFSFQLEIKGNGDARRWDVPVPVTNGTFETYEPKIISDQVFDDNNQLSHSRTVAYNLIPAEPGEYEVYVPLTYFDPLDRQYKTITSDTIRLQVTKGTGVRVDTSSSANAEEDELDLMPVSRVWLKDRFWTSFPHLFLFALLLSGSGYGTWLLYQRSLEDKVSAAEKMRKNAGTHLRSQLEDLATSQAPMSSASFFEKATALYHRFLSERFDIPPSELDEENLKNYLGKANVSREAAGKAVDFFNQCLAVRYGGIPGGYSREEMLQKCRELADLLDE